MKNSSLKKMLELKLDGGSIIFCGNSFGFFSIENIELVESLTKKIPSLTTGLDLHCRLCALCSGIVYDGEASFSTQIMRESKMHSCGTCT